MTAAVRLCLWLSLSVLSTAIFIPGRSIASYRDGESIPLIAEKIVSPNSPRQYGYFDLPFICPRSEQRHGKSLFTSTHTLTLNLWDVVFGTRVVVSDFDITMGKTIPCRRMCTKSMDWRGVQQISKLIEEHYFAKFVLDNLIGARNIKTIDRRHNYYSAGFRLGYRDISPTTGDLRTVYNNHLTFIFRWRRLSSRRKLRNKKVIVGFEVYPQSIDPSYTNSLDTKCPPADLPLNTYPPLELQMRPNATLLANQQGGTLPDDPNVFENSHLDIPYSYSVFWREDRGIDYERRWDRYFVSELENEYHRTFTTKRHIAALVASASIVCVLAIAVIMAWNRVRRIDGRHAHAEVGKTSLANTVELLPTDDDSPITTKRVSMQEEPVIERLKPLHPDTFRVPASKSLFSALIGTGMQVFLLTSLSLLLNSAGVFSQDHSTRSRIAAIAIIAFATAFPAYFGGKLYKRFGGLSWRKNAITAVLLLDSITFAFFFLLNLFVWLQSSSVVVPFSTVVTIHALALAIQLPLVYTGGSFALKKGEHSRLVMPRTFQSSPPASSLSHHFDLDFQDVPRICLSGVIPFLEIYADLPLVIHKLVRWRNSSQTQSILSSFTVLVALHGATVAGISLLMTYNRLRNQNYRWLWHSFFTGASSTFWLFAYCVWHYYWTIAPSHELVPGLLFLGYALLACVFTALFSGTVGFLASYVFALHVQRNA